MIKREEYSPQPPLAVANTEPFTCQKPLNTQRKKKKNKSNRRFSDEQITSLESLFKLENKLEPRKKLQMAMEIGLQPRQVAIWFQNRRARWKSKHLEQEYRELKAEYDNLNLRFESLKKEKHSLLIQLKKLCNQLKKAHDGGSGSKDLEGNSTDSGSENGDTNFELNVSSSCLSGGLDQGMLMYSDDDERRKTSYLAQKEAKFLNMGEQVDGFSEPPEKWSNFDLGGLFDQSCSTSNWWDFWT